MASIFKASILFAVLAGACQEHRVGGEVVSEVFRDHVSAALADAACAGNVAEVQRLIETGANPNALGLHGESLLFWAVSCENVAGVTALMDAGADPNYRGRFGVNAMTIAATYRSATMLRLLLRHGSNKNAAEDTGETAIQIAFDSGVRNGWWDSYYALLRSGANPVTLNGHRTMIAHAIYANHYEKALELLRLGFRDGAFEELARIPLFSSFDGSGENLRDRVQFLLWLKDHGVAISKARQWVESNSPRNNIDAITDFSNSNDLNIWK